MAGSSSSSGGGGGVAGRGSGKATSFIPELQSMMFALGDSRRPLHETAALVEDIVHTQLINMLHQAAEVSLIRGARVISAEDILFLMRKDKKKVRRLMRYMQFRDYKSKVLKTIEDEEPAEQVRERMSHRLAQEGRPSSRPSSTGTSHTNARMSPLTTLCLPVIVHRTTSDMICVC